VTARAEKQEPRKPWAFAAWRMSARPERSGDFLDFQQNLRLDEHNALVI
jgi:hypothetical protein